MVMVMVMMMMCVLRYLLLQCIQFKSIGEAERSKCQYQNRSLLKKQRKMYKKPGEITHDTYLSNCKFAHHAGFQFGRSDKPHAWEGTALYKVGHRFYTKTHEIMERNCA